MKRNVASMAGRSRYGTTPSQEKNAGFVASKPEAAQRVIELRRREIDRHERERRRDLDSALASRCRLIACVSG